MSCHFSTTHYEVPLYMRIIITLISNDNIIYYELTQWCEVTLLSSPFNEVGSQVNDVLYEVQATLRWRRV